MATTQWIADPVHSEIEFKIKHLMITTVPGRFNDYQVTAETQDDDFTTAKINFTAEINSITTSNTDRDNHLKSTEFFDAATFPQLKFQGSQMKKIDEEKYQLNGDLTIRDVTKNIKLDVEFGGIVKDPYGQTKAGFTLNGKISRKEFGLTWNAVTETGGVVVSDDVRLACEVQIIQQQ